jgi:uncharacterized protein (DUF2267 family)
MTTTGLETFDTTVQKTNQWINELESILGWNNKHRTFQALRVTLHALRDRLTTNEAVELGAQLPILLAGFYYESWKPESTPTKARTKDQFLSYINDYFQNIDVSIDAEQVTRSVFKLLYNRIADGEIAQVVHLMPSELRELWPEPVRSA